MSNTTVNLHITEEDKLHAHHMEVGKEKRIVHVLALGDVSVYLSLEQLKIIEESIHDYLKPGHHGPEPELDRTLQIQQQRQDV